MSWRTLYSRGRLGIDPSLFLESEASLQPGQAVFKEKIRDAFISSRLKNVFIDDIDKFLALSVTPDLALAREMISEVVKDDILEIIHPVGKDELFLSFNTACHLLGEVEEASTFWKDPTIKDVLGQGSSAEKLRAVTIYLDLLLKSEEYEELIEFFAVNEEYLITHSTPVFLVLLAHYKQGTRQALTKSVAILSKFSNEYESKQKIFVSDKMAPVVALLAYNLQEYAKAFDILQHFAKQKSYGHGPEKTFTLRSNSLIMMILAKSGRVEEAIEILREWKPVKQKKLKSKFGKDVIENKRQIIFAAVETVVAAASKADPEIFREVMEMVGEIEESAEVVEGSMEELLFETIEHFTARRSEDRSSV